MVGFLISFAIFTNFRKSYVLYPGTKKEKPTIILTVGSEQLNKQVSLNYILQTSQQLENFEKSYDYPPVKQVKDTVRIPVFLWHHVGPVPGYKSERTLNVSIETFRQQMEYLKAKEYRTLSIDEFIYQIKSGNNPKQKSVLLTFDDGYMDNYTNVFPILKEFGFKATFFIPVNKAGINKSQLKEMAEAGMDIESHTLNHRSLGHNLSGETLINEVKKSKSLLEEATGKQVKAFAYPYCVFNDQNIKYIKEQTDYQIAFQCGSIKGTSIDMSWESRYILYRSWAFDNLDNFKRRISGYEKKPIDTLPENEEAFHLKII